MVENLKNLFFDRKRSNEEYQIVLDTIRKINTFTYNRSYGIYPWTTRSKNYEELQKLPTIIYDLQRENDALKLEVKKYKEKAETVSSVMDRILDTVEKRYEMTKGE
jgi:hypothetical protein